MRTPGWKMRSRSAASTPVAIVGHRDDGGRAFACDRDGHRTRPHGGSRSRSPARGCARRPRRRRRPGRQRAARRRAARSRARRRPGESPRSRARSPRGRRRSRAWPRPRSGRRRRARRSCAPSERRCARSTPALRAAPRGVRSRRSASSTSAWIRASGVRSSCDISDEKRCSLRRLLPRRVSSVSSVAARLESSSYGSPRAKRRSGLCSLQSAAARVISETGSSARRRIERDASMHDGEEHRGEGDRSDQRGAGRLRDRDAGRRPRRASRGACRRARPARRAGACRPTSIGRSAARRRAPRRGDRASRSRAQGASTVPCLSKTQICASIAASSGDSTTLEPVAVGAQRGEPGGRASAHEVDALAVERVAEDRVRRHREHHEREQHDDGVRGQQPRTDAARATRLSSKHVADAARRHDLGRGRQGAQLAPQARDVGVDRVLADDRAGRPCRADDLEAAQRLARPARRARPGCGTRSGSARRSASPQRTVRRAGSRCRTLGSAAMPGIRIGAAARGGGRRAR